MMSRIIIRGTDFLIVPEGMVGELWTAGPGVGVG
jgi:hypothetical protein